MKIKLKVKKYSQVFKQSQYGLQWIEKCYARSTSFAAHQLYETKY
jgi:hypothetical protein